MFAKARRRILEERAARDCKAPHDRRAVILRETGCRSAGRVVAALAFTLEQDHRGERCELASGTRAGDPAADDYDVRCIGTAGVQEVRACSTGIPRSAEGLGDAGISHFRSRG